jgi:hypothetical protein
MLDVFMFERFTTEGEVSDKFMRAGRATYFGGHDKAAGGGQCGGMIGGV